MHVVSVVLKLHSAVTWKAMQVWYNERDWLYVRQARCSQSGDSHNFARQQIAAVRMLNYIQW